MYILIHNAIQQMYNKTLIFAIDVSFLSQKI